MAVRRITTLQGPTLKADDGTTAATIADSTGQITVGATNGWTLPVNKGTNDKYVLQIDTTAGASNWVESLTAPEITSISGKLNAYEAPLTPTGTWSNGSTAVTLSSGTDVVVGASVTGTGIANGTTVQSISGTSLTLSQNSTAAGSGSQLVISKTAAETLGGILTISGSNMGTSTSDLLVVIQRADGTKATQASRINSATATTCVAQWFGNEGNYDTFGGSSAGDNNETIYVKVTKTGLASNIISSGKKFTTDPNITTELAITQTGGEVSVAPSDTTLGSYGAGKVAGGGSEYNTKLFLDFDRFGGIDFEDSSNTGGNALRAIPGNQAVIKSSPFGDGKSAMYFDGTTNNKLVVTSTAAIPDGGETRTIDFWMYLDDATNNYQYLFWYGTTANNSQCGLALRAASTYIRFIGGSNDHDLDAKITSLVKKWVHVALVWDGTNLRGFVDGIRVMNTAPTALTTGGGLPTDLTIGNIPSGGTPECFNGYIDEFRVSSVDRSNSGESFTVPTSRYATDSDTKLLIHSDRSGALGESDRSNNITITYDHSLDGTGTPSGINNLLNATHTGTYSWFFANGQTSGNIVFDFGVADIVNKIVWVENGTNSQGQWSMYGSNDNTTYTSAFTGFSNVALGEATTTTITFTNTTAYRYYKLSKTGTGATNNADAIASIRFYNTADSDGKASDSDKFKDFSASGHIITPTDAYHSQGHGGIAPALAWPGSGKATGSCGVFFDGNLDWLKIGHTNSGGAGYYSPVLGTSNFTIDFWLWPSNPQLTGQSTAVLWDGRSSGQTSAAMFMEMQVSTNQLRINNSAGAAIGFSADTAVSLATWSHIAVIREGSGTTGLHRMRLYINGVLKASTNDGSDAGNITAAGNSYIGGEYSNSDSEFTGFIDNFRICLSDESVSGGSLYNATADRITVPTKIYGSFGSSIPDVGTITITATPSTNATTGTLTSGATSVTNLTTTNVRVGDRVTGTGIATGTTTVASITTESSSSGGVIVLSANSTASGSQTLTFTPEIAFSEQGSSLPVGIELTDGGAGANTATLAGTMTGTAGTDSAVRIRMQANNDTDRISEINESAGVGALSMTKVATGEPTLFTARRYAGKGAPSYKANSITGLGFRPDLLWLKWRNHTSNWDAQLYDSMRGAQDLLIPSSGAGASNTANGVISFDSDGFTMQASAGINNSNAKDNYVCWAWKAGGKEPSADGKRVTDGVESTISTDSSNTTEIRQSVNTAGGFSITRFKGGSGKKTPHGLGEAPAFIIIKVLTSAYGWFVYHTGCTSSSGASGTGNDGTYKKSLQLNSNNGEQANTNYFTPLPDSTNYSSSNAGEIGGDSALSFIMYAWKAVAGVSAFGSYDGGTASKVLDLGFNPSLVMIKCKSTTGHWMVFDVARSGANTHGNTMVPYLQWNTDAMDNSSNNEVTWYVNGSTKGVLLGTTDAETNGSSKSYVYAAWA